METANINNTGSSAVSASGTKKTATKDLDKNAFLSLLVAQLKNQDPTASSDPNAMVQQMTSFSSLEQMQNMNTSLTSIQNQNSAIFQAQSANLIGKQVQVTSSTLDLKDGSSNVGITLAASAASVSLKILDAGGNVVATLNQGSQAAGDHMISWNGKDASGNQLPNGTYSVAVSALDSAGANVTATTSASMRVDSVYFNDGTITVLAGGRTFPLSDIKQLSA